MAALGRAVCKTGPAEAGATHEPEAVSRHLSHVHATRMCECVGPRLTRQLDAARLNVSFEGVCRVICKTLLNAPIVFPLNFIMVMRRVRRAACACASNQKIKVCGLYATEVGALSFTVCDVSTV